MYVGLSVGFELGLEQKLTPQQVQYLKLLQLTGLQLEQHIHQELEMNPMIEEGLHEDIEFGDDVDVPAEPDSVADEITADTPSDELSALDIYNPEDASNTDENSWQDYIEDDGHPSKYSNDEDNGGEPIPIQSTSTFVEDLLDQIRMLDMTEEEQIVAEEILWSVESSGYLQRELEEIADAANEKIDVLNEEHSKAASQGIALEADDNYGSYAYDDTEDFTDHISISFHPASSRSSASGGIPTWLQHVTVETVVDVLTQVQTLDPPGIAARDLRECLLAQLRSLSKLNAGQQLAQQVLLRTYDAFKMKHYEVIMRELKVTEEYLREAIRAIRALNPKPGGGDTSAGTGSIIPDFFIFYDQEKQDFIIQLNDSRVPNIRVNKMYEQMKSQVREIAKKGMKSQRMNKDAKKFFKQKYDDAKFLIQALKQRRQTMIRVMTAIAYRQREFFLKGKDFIRPLIYKNIAEDTGVDISTVCRVVNNKYTQTDYGIFELRYFFSEGLPMPKMQLDENGVATNGRSNGTVGSTNGSASGDDDDGIDEVSTRIVKDKLKELIENEPKNKPLSDDKLAQELTKIGFNIARRTVAKYRDLMNISPARLRREL